VSAVRIRLVARVGVRRSRLPPYLLASLGGHVLAGIAAVTLGSFGHRPRIPEGGVVIVDLVAPVVAVAPAPQPAAVAPPPPAEPLRPPRDEPEPPKRKIQESKPKEKEKKQPARASPPAAPPPDDQQPVSSGGPAGPPDASAASIAPLDVGAPELAWYQASVTAALYGEWRKPLVDRLAGPVEVRVVFDIGRDGSVRNLRVERPSGIPSFDRSALAAVSDAAPLPPLPPSWREPVLPAGFVFRLLPES
jgi:TonB family protein